MSNVISMIKNIVKSTPLLKEVATLFIDKNLKWKYFSLRNKPFTYSLIDGTKIKLYPNGQIARGIFSGWFEFDDLVKFQKFIMPGMVVIDIGANIGLYTLIASKLVKDNGKVFSFEPSKSTYYSFLNNLNLNNSLNVKSYNIGLGDVENQILALRLDEGGGDADKYFIPTGATLNEGLSNVGTVKELEEQIKLETLDSALRLENIQSVDFVKIDTEGYEYFIIKGGQEILKSSPKVIVFLECTESGTKRAGVTQDMVYQLLKDCGLKIFYWDTVNNKWGDDESIAKTEGMIWASKSIKHLEERVVV